MNYLKINNSDVFPSHDKKTIPFNNIEECIKICIINKYTGFVIYNNTVYFRNNKFKDLILNLHYFEKSDSYLIIPNNLICDFLFSEKYRVNFYCKGILKDKILLESNNSYTVEKLHNKINNDYKEGERNWDKQHHENLLKYINNVQFKDDIKYTFLFKLYWGDLSYGIKEPTFVKSRPKKNYYKSVLLPLEDIYLFSNEFYKIKNDISFEKKKNGIVWRGVNSGFTNEHHRANRYELVSKFYNNNNKNFNIGFSYMNYNKIEQEKNNNFIKGVLSIEEQLKYKFILSVEGNDFATNLLWILLSNSIPICPVHYIETWSMETKLKPWIHYVPVKNDFGDLEKNFQKISKNKKLCNEILLNKKLFAFQFLDKEREMNIIKKTIELYRKNTNDKVINETVISNKLSSEEIINLKLGQKIMTNILYEFDRICRKYDLHYWCTGGTLIGILKFKNWLPWDGDIDVAIIEEDYNKFKKVIDKELPNSMIFSEPLNKPCSKIRSNISYYYFTDYSYNCDINMGVQLNIVIYKKNKNELISKFIQNDYHNYNYDVIFPLKNSIFNNINVYIPNQFKKYSIINWKYYPPKSINIDKRFPHEGRICNMNNFNYKIIIFYHICEMGNWKEIVNEQIALIKKSNLYDCCESINLSFLGNKNEILPYLNNKIKLIYNSNDIKEYEIPTINKLLNFCKNNNNEYYILYIHNKGATNRICNDINGQYYWRQLMNHWNIYNYIENIDSLNKGYLTSGINLMNNNHYSGNFWWANSKYIKLLDYITNKTDRMMPEFWLLSKKITGKHISLYGPYVTSVGCSGLYSTKLNISEHTNKNIKII